MDNLGYSYSMNANPLLYLPQFYLSLQLTLYVCQRQSRSIRCFLVRIWTIICFLVRIFRIWTINHLLKWIHITSFRKSVQTKFVSIFTVKNKTKLLVFICFHNEQIMNNGNASIQLFTSFFNFLQNNQIIFKGLRMKSILCNPKYFLHNQGAIPWTELWQLVQKQNKNTISSLNLVSSQIITSSSLSFYYNKALEATAKVQFNRSISLIGGLEWTNQCWQSKSYKQTNVLRQLR